MYYKLTLRCAHIILVRDSQLMSYSRKKEKERELKNGKERGSRERKGEKEKKGEESKRKGVIRMTKQVEIRKPKQLEKQNN